MRILVGLLLLFAAGSAHAQGTQDLGIQDRGTGRRFVSVSFHDIVDTREELTTDAVTADKLVRFFDWLKGTGWTVVSLDDVAAARQGKRTLPDKAILLTFDDGYRSLYTRVFPLLKVYRYPAVAAVVGTWLEGAPGSTVRYGDFDVPRSKFITWAEGREMQASSLVEFASHSYDMHWGARANPQGNAIPAARTWRYDPATTRYENDDQHRARIRADLDRSRRQIAAGLGRAPRALVWPFDRFSGPALEEAKAAGFTFAFTLEAEPADAASLLAIHRYFPNLNPDLGEIADNLRFDVEAPETARVALDGLAALQGAAQDAALGTMIENIRTLGANKVVIDGQAALPAPESSLGEVFFPTSLRPMRADLLSRAVWQLRSRAGVEVYVHLPLAASVAAVGEAGTATLYADMMRHAAADGIVVEAPAQPPSAASGHKNAVRARRAALVPAALDANSRLALSIYRAAAVVDPLLRLMLSVPAPAGPADWADYILSPPAAGADGLAQQAARLRAEGWLRPELAGHVVLGMPVAPAAQVAGLRAAQRQGATGFALCPGMPSLPPSAALSAAFSAAVFPYRP